MFPPTDNPAQRLLDLLNQAQAISGTDVQKLWARIFEMPKMDVPTTYRVLAHLNELVDAVELRIRQLPELNHDLYLRDLPTIRSILCPTHINQSWDQTKGPLMMGVLTGLEFCANELRKHHSEDPIPKKNLDEVRAEFADLFKAVADADIASDLKLVLFDLLTSAILAIDRYKIVGNDGLKKAIAYSIGMLTLHKNEFHNANGESFFKRTVTIVKHLSELLLVAYRVKQLGGHMPDILHLPHP